MERHTTAGRRERGATYLLLLIAVALISAGLAGGAQLASALSRAQMHAQLDWVGNQYRQAIGSYYEASPGSMKTYPVSLEALLFDHRYLTMRRHLRALYPNPATAMMDWQFIRTADGGIRGVQVTDAFNKSRQFIYQPVAQSSQGAVR